MGYILLDSLSPFQFCRIFFISNSKTTQRDVTKSGYGERERQNVQGSANGQQEPGREIWKRVCSCNPPDDSKCKAEEKKREQLLFVEM